MADTSVFHMYTIQTPPNLLLTALHWVQTFAVYLEQESFFGEDKICHESTLLPPIQNLDHRVSTYPDTLTLLSFFF